MRFEAVVVGAGSTGTSIAFHLMSKGAKRVLLIDKSCLGCGQTSVSSAIIRTQYSHPETRKMAVWSWRFIREKFVGETECPHSPFYEIGVAYGASREQESEVRQVASALVEMGVEVKLMNPQEFAEAVHPINTEGLSLVSWEPHGGFGDPHTLVSCFAEAARRRGLRIKQGVRVVGLDMEPGGDVVRGVRLETGETVSAEVVINAMNVWCNTVLSRYGLDLPLVVAKEEVVVFSHPGHRAGPVWADLVLGFYSRRESSESTLVGSLEPAQVASGEGVEPGFYTKPPARLVFERGVAANRFPELRESTPKAAWYGYYDVSPDWQPILGPDHRAEGLVHAVGLSGHGFKLSPAIGDVVSDIVLRGEPRLVDPEPFRPSRFWEGRGERGRFKYGILG